jgi:hypothetical protein
LTNHRKHIRKTPEKRGENHITKPWENHLTKYIEKPLENHGQPLT